MNIGKLYPDALRQPLGVVWAVTMLIAVVIIIWGIALHVAHSGKIDSRDSISLLVSPPAETIAQAFPGISPGTQVTVVDSSNDVIATAVLTQGPVSIGPLLNGEFLNFTVTVPAGLPRYGIEVPGLATMWASEQEMRAGVTVQAEK